MPHVAFVPLAGVRVRAEEMLALGMSLPGLQQRAQAIGGLPALGLLTLAGMTPEPWTCSYHEAAHWDEQLVEEVAATRPTLVALSALTASIGEAYSLSGRFRTRGIPVVLGGLHATVCPEEASRFCDAVVVGEGEPVWRAILDDAGTGSLRRVYRSSDPFDLALSPVPRFSLANSHEPARWTLQTERGCPFACDFCGASRLLGRFREKPVARLREEIDEIRRVSPSPWLELADDNTFAGNRNVDELFEVLGEANARYFTEADWRIGERPGLLGKLADSGCVQVLVGIESLQFRYSGMGAKQSDLERIMDALRAVQDAGVVVNGCFIVGADGDTDESLDRLVQFVLESPLAEVQLTLQTPFPGTDLYQRLRSAGRLLDDRDWSHYTLFDVTYRPDTITVEQLERGFRRVIQAVFGEEPSRRRTALRKQIWKRHPRFRRNDV